MIRLLSSGCDWSSNFELLFVLPLMEEFIELAAARIWLSAFLGFLILFYLSNVSKESSSFIIVPPPD